jgi:hypothetical protein
MLVQGGIDLIGGERDFTHRRLFDVPSGVVISIVVVASSEWYTFWACYKISAFAFASNRSDILQ